MLWLGTAAVVRAGAALKVCKCPCVFAVSNGYNRTKICNHDSSCLRRAFKQGYASGSMYAIQWSAAWVPVQSISTYLLSFSHPCGAPYLFLLVWDLLNQYLSVYIGATATAMQVHAKLRWFPVCIVNVLLFTAHLVVHCM